MMGQWSKKLLLMGVAAVVLAVAPAARAGMIPVSVTVTPDADKFRWTYGVIVTTDVQVNPGDSFTIYDFHGYVDGSAVAPDGWTFTASFTSDLHPGTNPVDDPGVVNLTFTYVGTDPIPGQSGLGNFWALSDLSSSITGDFTSSAHRQIDGRVENNITTTDVPAPEMNPPSETPEPATLALVGLGLPLVGLARWVRRRRA